MPGGICDMTQLKMFFDNYNDSLTVFDAYNYDLGVIPDGNINSKFNYFSKNESFRTFLGVKYVKVKDFRAFGFLENGQKIYFLGSHFQGRAKGKMGKYSTSNYSPKNFSNIFNSLFQQLIKKFRAIMIAQGKRLLTKG